MRESRGRTRHTLGREHETPRIVQRRDEYEGERERGQSCPSGDDPEGGRNPYTPRLPIYSQVTNWKAFYAKFSRYAEVSEWTEGECRDQLCWCLYGKASEYYALLVERNQEMGYMDLIRKLEKRFGFRELPETAQVQFNNARQTPDELREDWADRSYP